MTCQSNFKNQSSFVFLFVKVIQVYCGKKENACKVIRKWKSHLIPQSHNNGQHCHYVLPILSLPTYIYIFIYININIYSHK